MFCRFAGCNLWSGREVDRSSAICQFCDTDFVGTDGTHGGKFDSAQALAAAIASFWPATDTQHRFVVLTGGALLLWPGASARVVIGMIAYGAGIELAQWAVGWRFAEWSDLAADTVGVVGAWLLARRLQFCRSAASAPT